MSLKCFISKFGCFNNPYIFVMRFKIIDDTNLKT